MSCTRCESPAIARMSYDYNDRQIWIEDLEEPVIPGTGYAMCDTHAGKLTPPVGWTLTDLRSAERPLFLTLEVA